MNQHKQLKILESNTHISTCFFFRLKRVVAVGGFKIPFFNQTSRNWRCGKGDAILTGTDFPPYGKTTPPMSVMERIPPPEKSGGRSAFFFKPKTRVIGDHVTHLYKVYTSHYRDPCAFLDVFAEGWLYFT